MGAAGRGGAGDAAGWLRCCRHVGRRGGGKAQKRGAAGGVREERMHRVGGAGELPERPEAHLQLQPLVDSDVAHAVRVQALKKLRELPR